MLLVVFGVLFAMAGANLSPEERDRLIYKNDESVIMEKIKEMPEVLMNPPEYLDLPVPTMDPNLPLIMTRNNNKIRPNRFGDIMKNTLRMLRGNKNGHGNSPRNGRLLPTQRPEQRRPSSLTTSTADEIEMAFKRMEIMASRAGLNMSALPRRTQMQVIKRLKSFLPPRLGTMVAETMENEPKKMFSYLPEPARDPLIEDDPNYLTKFLAQDLANDNNNEFHSSSSPGKNEFESFASTSSLFASPSGPSPSDVSFSHLPAITEAYEGRDEPSPSLVPPHFDGIEFSRQVSPPTLNLDTYNEPDSSQQQTHIHHLNTRDRHHLNPEAAPLIAESHSVFSGSENIPVIISPNSKINPGRFEKSLKNLSMITPTPILRVSSPTKEKIIVASSPVASSTVKPIRVSIISKDSLTSGDPMVKVINIDPIVSTSQSVTMVRGNSNEEIPISNSPYPITTTASTTMSPGLQVKEMIDSVIEAEKDKHERQREREIAQVKEALKPITNPINDFYDYTESEEMRALEELKKYEDLYDNSLEHLQPHPLEYPDHPDHPKDESQPGPSPSPSAKPALSMRPNRLRVPPHQHRPGRPRPPFHPNQFKQRPQRPRPRPRPNKRPPLRINDVTISTMPQHFDKECDFFSDEICLLVQDYPIEAISEALDQNPVLKQMLIKEPSHISYVEGVPKAQESNYNYGHYFDSHKHRDFAGEGGFLCPSKVAYGKVKKAKSASTGAWKFVVNYAENTQTLRLEKCLAPGNTCSYVMPHYRTACTQVYNYHRLLAWDSEKGLHMDVFKVPTCCTCHVQGYYIPGQSPRPAQLKFNSPPPPKKVVMEQPKEEMLPTPLPLVRNANNNSDRELQDLLQQYSSLREIIAKRRQAKNGAGKIIFPVNKDGAKRRRQSRRSNFPLERRNLKQMRERRLMARLTRQLRLRDNRQKLKILKEKLKLKTLGKGKGRRRQRQMSLGSYRKRELLNKYERIRGIRKRQKEHRLSYRRLPPKVNYSYHPIMDYFGRRRSLMKRKT